MTIKSVDHLILGAHLDDLLDTIAGVNQGAADIFRFNHETSQFDRISTTFRAPEGKPVGGILMEPGLIAEGHPGVRNGHQGPAVGRRSAVTGRPRYAYLTPILEPNGRVVGLLTVDVGWVDDLNRINSLAAKRALVSVTVLSTVMAVLGMVVMFFAFRPMHCPIRNGHDLGSDQGPSSLGLISRRDEIGYLAVGLSKIADRGRRAISVQHETSAGEMNVTASVGVTVVPVQSATPELALNLADLALYSVKGTAAAGPRCTKRLSSRRARAGSTSQLTFVGPSITVGFALSISRSSAPPKDRFRVWNSCRRQHQPFTDAALASRFRFCARGLHPPLPNPSSRHSY